MVANVCSFVVFMYLLAVIFKLLQVGPHQNLAMKLGYYLYANTKLGFWYYQRELQKARQELNGLPHSLIEPFKQNDMVIVPIPMSTDNYCYLIIDELDQTSVLIDAADPEAVQPWLDEWRVVPVAVLTTHRHWDHSAGNAEWRRRFTGIKVFGGALDAVPAATDSIADGSQLSFGRIHITALHTPAHTDGHVVYILDGTPFHAQKSLFSGDLLFIAGTGKMFEGNAETMLRSLDCLCQLPDDTLLWPGHEYSLTNLKFAASLEPDNERVREKLQEVNDRRSRRRCTCPSTVGAEKSYNPFLRTGDEALHAALRIKPSSGSKSLSQLRAFVLAECRARRDMFKPATD